MKIDLILYQMYIYMTNPHYKCFFLRMFISNIKLATDRIVSLLTLFISVFNLSLSDTVTQRSKLLLNNKLYSGILVKYFKRSSVYLVQ